MTFAWKGKYAEIDLSTNNISVKNLPKKLREKYLGSRGINSKFLYDRLEEDIDALDPENPLIFGVGPLTGTLTPGSGRWTVTSKSPLTGILGDSNAGGHWGPELKFAGFDHLIITGKADKPVYLLIEDGKIEVKDAKKLWGKDTWECTQAIKEEYNDPDIKVACIGPAGENLIKFSCIISERTRAAGRTGMGAVMGSKNLKAIAVKGRLPLEVAKPDEFKNTALKMHKLLREEWPAYDGLASQGTMSLFTPGAAIGWVTVNYFNSTELDLDKIGPEKFEKEFKKQDLGCFGCPVHCGHYYSIDEGNYKGESGEGPEYETMAAIGPKCGVMEMDATLHMTNLLNKYGLDSIDTGNAIAVLMDLNEKGYIDEDELGLDLSWGNVDTVIELIKKIAYKEGIGKILSKGSYEAVKELNEDAKDEVWQIKGMDNISVDMRALKGASLGYSTSTRGLDHLRGMCVPEEVALDPEASNALYGFKNMGNPDVYEEKPEGTVWLEKFTAAVGASGMCLFNSAWIAAPIGPNELAELLTDATGIDFTEEDIFTIGERIYNLERLLITDLGIRREDDYPPKKALEEPIPDGPRKGEKIDYDEYDRMLTRYYEIMGWDSETGIPLKGTLNKLGIEPRGSVD